ncbi:SDR family oxidoreductase [Mycobacterium sp. 4D054]|uniref:SDR family oxidoreductase n=1 Tax=Mycobacterium sp. 4D054 TaxID=3457440 RepID=UPI003FD4CE8A
MSTAPLAGRRALVTGGSRGIGAEIVRRLASDDATVVAIQADSADPAQVARAVEQTVAELDGLDILVNNSAVAHLAPIDEFPAEEFDRLVAINMTKGAVSSFTRGLARDLGSRGITVTNVQPGPIDTDANPDDGAFAESLKQVTAQGHYGHTSDVASLVSFLAGPESGYITGAHLNVDGGFTV